MLLVGCIAVAGVEVWVVIPANYDHHYQAPIRAPQVFRLQLSGRSHCPAEDCRLIASNALAVNATAHDLMESEDRESAPSPHDSNRRCHGSTLWGQTMRIELELEPRESAMLLRYLRSVPLSDIERTLGSADDASIFERASEKLRTALREGPAEKPQKQ